MAQQFMVPQSLDIEDKIIGPFTLKQFIYLVSGAITAYFLYIILKPFGLVIVAVAAFPVALLTFALVFIKVNERPFTYFISSFLSFAARPQKYVWERLAGEDLKVVTSEQATTRREEVKKIKVSGEGVKSRLEELAMIVDVKGWGEAQSKSKEQLGLVVSSPESKQTFNITLPQEKELEDVFAAFERTMTGEPAATPPKKKPSVIEKIFAKR